MYKQDINELINSFIKKYKKNIKDRIFDTRVFLLNLSELINSKFQKYETIDKIFSRENSSEKNKDSSENSIIFKKNIEIKSSSKISNVL